MLFVEAVSDSSSSRLIYDSKNIDPGNGSSILGGLSLGVVEVSWYSDHSGLNWFHNEVTSSFNHLLEDQGRDLFRLKDFLLSLMLDNNGWLIIRAGLDLEWPKFDITLHELVLHLSSDKSFSIKDGVGGVSGGLVLCRISNESLFFIEGDV